MGGPEGGRARARVGGRARLTAWFLGVWCVILLASACGGPTAASGPTDPHEAPDPPDPPPRGSVSADTLFVESWESGDLSRWEDTGRVHLAEVRTDPAFAAEGQRYLRVRVPAGGPGPWLNRFFMPGTETDQLYVRYRLRLRGDWSGGSKTFSVRGSRVDDRWSAFGIAGRCPTGTDFFRIGVITQAYGNPGDTRLYVYYPGMRRESDGVTCYGRYSHGDHAAVYRPPLQLERDRWHRVELWAALNRPGIPDGEIKLWIDGTLRGHWSGIRLRDAEDLKLNSVQIDASMSELPGSVDRVLYYDDILVLNRLPDPDS